MNHQLTGEEARIKIKSGVDKAADIIKCTLGAKGRNVIISIDNGKPFSSKDGVTVAKSIILEDELENQGAALVLQASERTAAITGDASTTVVVLTQKMVEIGFRNITAGANPMDLLRGMNKAKDKVIAYVRSEAVRITDKYFQSNTLKMVQEVATISGNNDVMIGRMIAGCYKKVGDDGYIKMEEVIGNETNVVYTSGLNCDTGFVSPYFMNNPKGLNCILKDVLVCVCEWAIEDIQEVIPLLTIANEQKKPLLIIAEKYSDQVIGLMIANMREGRLQVCCIRHPQFGTKRRDFLQDIAIATGGKLISEQLGYSSLLQVKLEDLGRCDSIESNRLSTQIVGGKGDTTARLALLKEELTNEATEHNREKLQQRISKLTGIAATIYVGGSTDIEMKERGMRIEDALMAVKSAVEESVVTGGGVIYLRAASVLADLKGSNDDETTGIRIVAQALSSPIETIAANSGKNGETVRDKVLDMDIEHGYNALTDEYGNMIEYGVLDPCKVVRVAIENAVSVASVILTTEALVIRDIKKSAV